MDELPGRGRLFSLPCHSSVRVCVFSLCCPCCKVVLDTIPRFFRYTVNVSIGQAHSPTESRSTTRRLYVTHLQGHLTMQSLRCALLTLTRRIDEAARRYIPFRLVRGLTEAHLNWPFSTLLNARCGRRTVNLGRLRSAIYLRCSADDFSALTASSMPTYKRRC